MSLHDTDKATCGDPASQPNTPVKLVTTKMGFQHPEGFEPAAFLIIGMSKEGKPFINMPYDQPHLCLHLATIALARASELAVTQMQEALKKKSPILAPPPGLTIPPWRGPAGQG